jgi:hypothetical protein
MAGPSAIESSLLHGLNGKLNVNMSESDRMPGYRKRSQVPPIDARASRIA